MTTKICSTCKLEKNLSDFTKNKSRPDGYSVQCKVCKKAYYEENYVSVRKVPLLSEEERKERALFRSQLYNSKEETKEKKKKYWESNAKQIGLKRQRKRQENQEEYLLRDKQYRDENRERIRQYNKQYLKSEKAKSWRKTYRTKKIQTDIKFAINGRIRTSLRNTLANLSIYKKGSHWENILGYTSQQLIEHLETTLPEGITLNMALKQKKSFHIDHIIPISAYTITSIDDLELKKCWNYRNLRMLEASENINKANMLDMELVKKFNIEDLLPKDAGTEHCP
jgi:hypothetical protein